MDTRPKLYNQFHFPLVHLISSSRQIRHREGVEFGEDNLNVTSRQYQRYEFDARASAPYNLDDRFNTLAMHVLVSRISVFYGGPQFVQKNRRARHLSPFFFGHLLLSSPPLSLANPVRRRRLSTDQPAVRPGDRLFGQRWLKWRRDGLLQDNY